MENIHKKIKKVGGRVTKNRKAILATLKNDNCLMSKKDIVRHLHKKKYFPDRTTIYRELTFLTKNGFVLKNNISGVDYYEMPDAHHHHLVCLDCKCVERVDMQNHLNRHEKIIEKHHRFRIVSHTLEFFGYCKNCQKASKKP